MTNFKTRVLELVKNVPTGNVASYGQIAALAGSPRAARVVGEILKQNGHTLPWWRIVNNKGFLSIRGNDVTKDTQKKLLESENIPVSKNYMLDIEKYRWHPGKKFMNIATVETYLDNYL